MTKHKLGRGTSNVYESGLSKLMTSGIYTHLTLVLNFPSYRKFNGFKNCIFNEWSMKLYNAVSIPHYIIITSDLNFHVDNKFMLANYAVFWIVVG